jgi:hypothetical protein
MSAMQDTNNNKSTNTFSVVFKQRVKEWLYEKGSDTFEIDDEEYQLIWDSNRDVYEVWLDGELLAWNDNHKDFVSVGDFISSHRKIFNGIYELMNNSNIQFDKNFQQWNCEQLREWNNDDYPNT